PAQHGARHFETGVLNLFILLGRRLTRCDLFVEKKEFHFAALAWLDCPAGKPAGAFLVVREILPDAFDRAGQGAHEAYFRRAVEGSVLFVGFHEVFFLFVVWVVRASSARSSRSKASRRFDQKPRVFSS